MTNITLKQLRSDFNFLYENIDDYAVNEDALVNVVYWELIDGQMSIKDYLLWCIKDLVSYVYEESMDTADMEFLETNSRAIRILNRYNIKTK